MNASHIVAALRRSFPHPDFGFATEVAQATGFNARRHLDVVVMDTWPSRGLELMGFEIKVSTGDLNRELAQPQKAEEIARFCNSFWLATPKGLVKDPSKLPFAWGLYEVDDDGGVKRVIAAKRKDSEPLGREFVAALMRGARRSIDKDEAAEAAEARVKRRIAELEAEFQLRVDRASTNNNRDAAAHRELREKLGDKYALLQSESVVKALNVVMSVGLHEGYSGLNGLGYALRHACEQVDQALVAAGLDPVTGIKRKRGE